MANATNVFPLPQPVSRLPAAPISSPAVAAGTYVAQVRRSLGRLIKAARARQQWSVDELALRAALPGIDGSKILAIEVGLPQPEHTLETITCLLATCGYELDVSIREPVTQFRPKV